MLPLLARGIRLLKKGRNGKRSRLRASFLGQEKIEGLWTAQSRGQGPTREGGGFEARPLFPRPLQRRRHRQSQLLRVKKIDLLWWRTSIEDVPAQDGNDWSITRGACAKAG